MTNTAPELWETLKISTPMPLAGHDHQLSSGSQPVRISTPMPLAGHDGSPARTDTGYIHNFYSHAPRGA